MITKPKPSDDEKSPLLKEGVEGSGESETNYCDIPLSSNGKDPSENGKFGSGPELPKKVPLSQLFRYATFQDQLIILVGTFFSVLHGVQSPVLAIIFGKMTNSFITQTYNYGTGTGGGLGQGSPSGTMSGLEEDSLNIPPDQFSSIMTHYSFLYLLIAFVAMLSAFAQTMCWEWACERQVYRIRKKFFHQILRQENEWFDGKQSGNLAMKLTDDVERIHEALGQKFSLVIQYISTFIAGIVVGLITSWQLTMVILCLTPLLLLKTAVLGKYISSQTTREQIKYGKAGGVAMDVLSSIRVVSSFGGETKEIERYETALKDGLDTGIAKYHVIAIGAGTAFFIQYVSYGLAFYYGSKLFMDGEISAGEIYTVLTSVLMGSSSLGNALPYLTAVGVAKGSGAIIFDVIDSVPDIDPYDETGNFPEQLVGKLEFQGVDFTYPARDNVPVLRDFNLTIEPGRSIAICGPSGSGKSTIANLLLRFYDPDGGQVLLDGHDLKSLNLKWLRSHIGLVSQMPILFGTTIFDNISYGNTKASIDEVINAAKLANAHDFIVALPKGYDTVLGERGAQLSGGQKQRIAIARALVRSPKILILDEATSALDSKSEAMVQAALEQAQQGRTCITIAHRLSTVKNADVIHTLKDGVIVESGTHDELMEKEGIYYELVMAQTSMDSVDETSAGSALESAEDSATELFDSDEFHRTKKRQRAASKILKLEAMPDPHKLRMEEELRLLPPTQEAPGLCKILQYNRPEWPLLGIGLFGCLITGSVMPIFTLLYAEMFNVLSKTGQELKDGSFDCFMMFLGLAVMSAIGVWTQFLFVSIAGEYLTMRLRLGSYISILRQPVSWFDEEANSPIRLTTRLARDAPLVKAAAGDRLATVISSIVTIIGAFVIAFYFGWELTLAILIAFPILIIAGYIQVAILKSVNKSQSGPLEDAGHLATEAIQNVKTVQALGLEELFFMKYREFIYPLYVAAHSQGFYYSAAFALSGSALYFIYAGAFQYGAKLVGDGDMIPINVFRVFFAIAFCATSIGHATSFIPDYQKAKLAAKLIFSLIELESPIDPFSPVGTKPDIQGDISFQEVQFSYPNRPSVKILQGISFKVQKGQTLALIGPSGCGKSTVVSLIERFYDVLNGSVTLDGFDIRSINLKHLRQSIGLVTQEPNLFDCTIRENIAYGYTGSISDRVPDDLIISAAKAANIHNFIVDLPMGYETFVGEAGAQLSGGQKQRIAIARALIRSPKLLLLDEATSALDSESERIVQEALEKATEGRTCIIIAHRLSTIQNADYIAVLSRGQIAEMGTPEQLRAKKGIYYKLTKAQHIRH